MHQHTYNTRTECDINFEPPRKPVDFYTFRQCTQLGACMLAICKHSNYIVVTFVVLLLAHGTAVIPKHGFILL